jgi:hypothetical protein
MKKTFHWKGVAHDVDCITLDEAETFLEAAAEMSGQAPLEQFRTARKMLTVLHCPKGVVKDILADDIGDALLALQAAHFGVDDSGNPDGGAATH